MEVRSDQRLHIGIAARLDMCGGRKRGVENPRCGTEGLCNSSSTEKRKSGEQFQPTTQVERSGTYYLGQDLN